MSVVEDPIFQWAPDSENANILNFDHGQHLLTALNILFRCCGNKMYVLVAVVIGI